MVERGEIGPLTNAAVVVTQVGRRVRIIRTPAACFSLFSELGFSIATQTWRSVYSTRTKKCTKVGEGHKRNNKWERRTKTNRADRLATWVMQDVLRSVANMGLFSDPSRLRLSLRRRYFRSSPMPNNTRSFQIFSAPSSQSSRETPSSLLVCLAGAPPSTARRNQASREIVGESWLVGALSPKELRMSSNVRCEAGESKSR
ncbi:hypothetical protein SODALDRAFT_378236 [Sodiomyces alkalinus F11]|uniref:Uncharacterized protein n=1 Tax=Sodiomyces alkalinus (strain CBS 110278 / VKM F-3762 / F11) TaxID=1314773 RepID=A0A3N2PXQ6_SODAK|nr:hypothetical protein SODALDRAFT_378236 [Sodiomyces alkalinus F11]ROT39125.1 hypothetical protein SODALDRAFT_378236 [Sodiomyces alkalinus F11]